MATGNIFGEGGINPSAERHVGEAGAGAIGLFVSLPLLTGPYLVRCPLTCHPRRVQRYELRHESAKGDHRNHPARSMPIRARLIQGRVRGHTFAVVPGLRTSNAALTQ